MADKPKRIPWLKYLLGGFIFLFLLLIIFYQPILFGVAQLVGQQVAKSQKLSLQFKIHGSIVSDLYLEDVHLEPLPGNSSFPVERLQARRVGARYNLLSVFRRDFLNLVDLIEAKDIDLALRPTPAPAPTPPQQKPAGPLRLVPVIPKKIDISNVNVTVHENGGDLVVRNLTLQFAQDRPGYLALDRLAVPALGQWQNLHADISLKQNVLQLAGLSIEPLLSVNQLSVDLNGLESGRLGLALAGRVLNADLTAQGLLTQEANAVSSASVKLANFQVDKLGSLVSVPMRGSVPVIDCALSGELQRPDTWDGRVLFTANNLQYLTYRVDDASATVTLTKGTGRIDPVIVRSGPNVISLNGNFRLPPDWDNFPARVSANLGLAVALQDPGLYLPGARGSALVSGNIGLTSGQAKSMIQVGAAGLGTGAVETSTARVNILAAAQVPLERDLWHSLAAVATANVGNIRAQQAHVADVSGSLDLRNGSSAELSASVRSGGSNSDLDAHAPLPAAGSAFDPKMIDGRLRFHVASISDFIEQQLVSGTFTADGDLTVHDLQPDGYIKAAGAELKFRDLVVPRVEVNATAANRVFKLDKCHVSFDESDYIDANGSAALVDPFSYQAYGRINFSDLKTFNALLKSFGLDQGLSGTLNASFTGKGDLKSQIPEANLVISGNQIAYRGLVFQAIEVNGDIKDKRLNLPTLKIVADSNNSISATGNAELNDPFPYGFNANIDLNDLGFLNPLLKSFGQEGGLSGKFHGTARGQSTGQARVPSGVVQLTGEQFKYHGLQVQNLNVQARADGNRATLEKVSVNFDPSNYIDVNGNLGLAEPFNYEAYGRVNFLDLKTFNALLKSFGPDPGLAGTLNASFTGKGDLKSQIPEEANLAVRGDQVAYRGLVLQDVEANGEIKDKRLNVPALKIVADPKNSISATGNAQLTDPLPYGFNANIDLNDLGFLNPLLKSLGQEGELGGKLHGTASAQSDSRTRPPAGAVQLAGEQIKYRNFQVQNLTVQTKSDGNRATVENAAVYFDPNNYVNLNGNATLAEPFNYEAYGRVNFLDLKTFNALLKSFGLDQGLSGTLNASFTGKGDLKSQIPEANLVISGNQVTYRGLVLQDVEINGDIKDKRLNLPTLKIVADSNNSISATGNAQLSDPLPYSFNANINLNDLGFLNPFLKSLGQESGLSGKLRGTAWAQGEGQTRSPTGVVQLAGEQFNYRNLQVQSLNVQARANGSQATLENATVNFDPNNYINVNGNLALTEPFNYEAFGRVSFSDLSTFNSLLKSFGPNPGLSGTLNASFTGKGDLKSQIPEANLVISGNQIAYRGLVFQDVEVNGTIKDKHLNLPTLKIVADSNNSISATGNAQLNDPFPYGFNADIDLNDLGFLNPLLKSFGQEGGLSGKLHGTAWAQGTGEARVPTGVVQLVGGQFKYHDLQVQNLNVQAKANGNQATLENVAIYFDSNNYVNLNGNAVLADPLTYEAYGRINFSNLRTFNALLKSFGLDQGLSGTLNASFTGKGDLKSQIPEANLAVSGSQIRYHGLVLRELEIDGDVKDKKLDLPVLKIIADQNNSVNGSGNALLTDPFPYESNLNVDFKDLRFLNPLLKSFGQDLGLGGKLGLTWSGKGELKNSVGNVRLNITGLQTKQVKQVQVDVEGHYEGLTAEVPKLQVISPFGNLDATLRATPESIQIPSLSARRGENVLTGNVQLPLNFEPGAKLPIAFDKPIVINLRTDRVSLASLQPGKPQITGNIGLNVQASGTVRDPIVQIQTKVEDLRSPQMPTFAAATAQLQVNLAQNTLTLDGGLKQADIQPLQIQGKIPLNLEQIIDSGRLPLDTPLQVAVKWPDTNLAFVRRLTPFVRVLEGNVAIDANVSGTLAKPNLAGEVRARIVRFKAQTDVVPPLSDFNLNVALNQDHITINQLGGNAAGGPFSVRGSIDLSNGTNPQMDLTVTGRQMLLTRSDNVIVRSNLDLSLRGPLAAVEVAGKVGITNSKFFQDIDILPLNLPGQPAPQPAGPPPNVSIDSPPLRDWKFNIKVQTDDPFLIQSNVARGEVLIDLQVGGTGLKPTVAGNVHIRRLTASLPFSHMDIGGSYINFSPDRNPLDPQLNIIGNSTVRDYEVTMRIFGPVSDFQILFDSSPPLSQGDIATLLATGATSSEFVQDPSLLAGRAAFLLIRKAYSSIFKSKANPQQEQFLNRLEVDFVPGAKVGTPDVSARFTLTKTWQVVAEFGSIGNVSGQLRYLIRFR